jgi:hypothetical protein
MASIIVDRSQSTLSTALLDITLGLVCSRSLNDSEHDIDDAHVANDWDGI